ncbi:MAG: sugar ABC transporter ATP-binding protein [Actinomycetes bacterium]
MPAEYVVEVRGLSKQFPGVRALDEASLLVRAGEIHGLVGENGAGKSTLIKILAGAQPPDAGSIVIDGREVSIPNEAAADALGLRFIHQDVALVPRLTVAENVFLGRPLPRRGPFVSRTKAHELTREVLRDFVDVDPAAPLSSLSVAERWMVGIGRSCAGDARMVVMDEPTVALADAEVERVFQAVNRLRDRGIAVLFVSHRLGEILQLANSVTVMKDGRTVGRHDISALDRQRLVSAIIGREAGELDPLEEPAEPHDDVVLEVSGLSGGPLRDISFSLRAGEILGIGGLVGSGRTSLMMNLFGHLEPTAGEIRLDGTPVVFRSPADAIRSGFALIPEDRRSQGLLTRRSVRENVVLTHLSDFRRHIRLPSPHRGRETDRTLAEIDRLRIATTGPEQQISTLSGGNQQKALLSRWLVGRATRVLMLDEPTKGVDIGAKTEILRLVSQLAAEGVAVIVASSDLEEVSAIAHRVIVLREGRLVGELHRPVTEAAILHLCYETATARTDGGSADTEHSTAGSPA